MYVLNAPCFETRLACAAFAAWQSPKSTTKVLDDEVAIEGKVS
jgi:hypothetical protein